MDYSGRGEITGATGLSSITGMISLEWGQEGTLSRGRSDYSEYPALYDYTHFGFRFTINFRSDDDIASWNSQRWLNDLTIEIEPPCANLPGSTVFNFKGVLLEKPQFKMTVGELGFYSLRGTSLSLLMDGVAVEGPLKEIRSGNSPNMIFDVDTANHWNPRGVF